MIYSFLKIILVYLFFTCELFAGSTIDLNGSLEKNISLGQTALWNINLSHKLKTAPQGANLAQSAWSCDFLTSYVAPDGRKGIQWVMPGGTVKRFKNREVHKSEPKSFKDEWTAVEGKTAGDVVFIS